MWLDDDVLGLLTQTANEANVFWTSDLQRRWEGGDDELEKCNNNSMTSNALKMTPKMSGDMMAEIVTLMQLVD